MPSSRVSKTIVEKLAVITWIEEYGDGIPTRVLKHFHDELNWTISGSQVRQWWKKRLFLRTMESQRRRTPGGDSKPVLRELEDILFDQVLYFRSNKEKLAGFMARFGLSLRRTTNLTMFDDEELTDHTARYMAFLGYLKPTMNLSRDVLMDDSSLFRRSKRQTVDLTGARHVVLRSTGFTSMRVTVVLAISALAKKLTPLVIWKGAKPGSKMQKIGTVYVMFQERAWVDSTALSEWIDTIFLTDLDHGKGKFLVWDSMRVQIPKAIMIKCEQKGSSMCMISGGLISYLRAGDIGLYSSFKEKRSSFTNAWKGSDQVDYTRGGDPRLPTIETVASGITLAWNDVPDTVVQKSVAATSFSNEATQWHIARHDVYGDLFRM